MFITDDHLNDIRSVHKQIRALDVIARETALSPSTRMKLEGKLDRKCRSIIESIIDENFDLLDD